MKQMDFCPSAAVEDASTWCKQLLRWGHQQGLLFPPTRRHRATATAAGSCGSIVQPSCAALVLQLHSVACHRLNFTSSHYASCLAVWSLVCHSKNTARFVCYPCSTAISGELSQFMRGGSTMPSCV